MQITEGKFYKTRDGRKIGPMERASGLTEWPWRADDWDDFCRDDGTTCNSSKIRDEPGDLIEEWTEPTATPAPTGPVRMVRQIMNGHYGNVMVYRSADGDVRIELNTSKHTADELRSAAMVFSQLAEALDDQP